MGYEAWEISLGRGYAPRASIRSNGQLGFNQGSIKRYELRAGTFVKLFYDRDEQKIGILRNVNEALPGALRMVVRENNAYVSAKSFLENYAIDYDVTYTGKLVEEETEFGTFLVISIKNMQKRKPRTKTLNY